MPMRSKTPCEHQVQHRMRWRRRPRGTAILFRPLHQLRPQPLNKQQQHQQLLQQLAPTRLRMFSLSPIMNWSCTPSFSMFRLRRSFAECLEQATAAPPHNPQARFKRRWKYPQGQLVPPGCLVRKGGTTVQRLQPCGSVGISTKSNFNIYEGLRLCFHFPSVFFPLIDVSWHVFVSGALFSGFCLLLLSLVLDINVRKSQARPLAGLWCFLSPKSQGGSTSGHPAGCNGSPPSRV